MYTRGKKDKAISHLEKSLLELEQYQGASSMIMTGGLDTVYGILAHCYMEQKDKPSAVRYSVLALRVNRYLDAALEAVLTLFKEESGQSENPAVTYGFLEKLYDFTSLRDRLYVMKIAKKVGFHSLYDLLYGQMGEEEQAWLDARPQSSYRLDAAGAREKYPEIPYRNETDSDFISLIEEVKKETEDTLTVNLKGRLEVFRKKQPTVYDSFIRFFCEYPLWGVLDPAVEEYEALEARVRSIKNHVEDMVWLYSCMCDNRSRRTLLAVLDNWLHMNTEGSAQTRETGRPYFDTDLIPDGTGAVFVDVGAYIGDSVQDYIKTYGEGYERIYCYEITPDSSENLLRNIRHYHNIEVRRKAAGDITGSVYIKENRDQSANQAVGVEETGMAGPVIAPDSRQEDIGQGRIYAEMVTLDEDIQEKISFIKLDIEGGEEKAIKGCAEHIRAEHPQIAVSICYGYI